MNISVRKISAVSFILLASSLVGAKHDITGKRSILEGLIPGVNVAASGIGLTSDFFQAPPQQIATQVPHQVAVPDPHQVAVQVPHPIAVPVPHPVAVPVPHPILVPVERPVPFAVDRPVPYPVPIIKKYFIPVGYKIPVPASILATHDDPKSENNSVLDSRPEITSESYRIYTNEPRRDRESVSSGNNDATANVAPSPSPRTRSTKRRSSFLIRVNGS